MKKLLDRLKEPSTYASLSALLVIFGISFEEAQLIANGAAAVAAIVGGALSEKGN